MELIKTTMNNDKIITIPSEILSIINSGKAYEKLEKIGNKYNLLIDQLGELNTYLEMVMVGKIKSSSFVKIISKELEISENVAQNIAKDVNTEILDSIRNSLRKIQDEEEANEPANTDNKISVSEQAANNAKTISAIEKAGDFSVDKQHISSSPQYKDTNISRAETLKGIEDDHIPLVDHLLTIPINNPQQVEVKKVEEIKPIAKKEENKTYTVDPYREQM